MISISDDDGGGDDDGENDVEDGNDGNRQRFVVKMKLLGNQAALQLVSEATRHQVTKKNKRTLKLNCSVGPLIVWKDALKT